MERTRITIELKCPQYYNLLLYLADTVGLDLNRFVDLSREKSDTPKQYVQKWITIVSASRLAKAKPEPEQKDFLLL